MNYKKILFLHPDYHSSFILRDELRLRGFKSDIYASHFYPSNHLWTDETVIRPPKIVFRLFEISKRKKFFTRMALSSISNVIAGVQLLYLLSSYDVIYQYGRSPNLVKLYQIFLIRLVGKRFFFMPAGCRDEDTKQNWKQIDNGRVCSNCGFEPNCSDSDNFKNIKFVNKYMSGTVGWGYLDSKTLKNQVNFPAKVIDLNLWKPNIEIPEKYLLPKTSKVRVLHSHSLKGRDLNGKNIKGTPFVLATINSLINKGVDVELLNVTGIPHHEMRFLQIQSDIVVDQLFYGWWGSTALECMALGKPVICYLNPDFLETWKKNFSHLGLDIPILSAQPDNLEKKLNQLIENKIYRQQVGRQSREFAEKFLDPKANIKYLLDFFDSDFRLSQSNKRKLGVHKHHE